MLLSGSHSHSHSLLVVSRESNGARMPWRLPCKRPAAFSPAARALSAPTASSASLPLTPAGIKKEVLHGRIHLQLRLQPRGVGRRWFHCQVQVLPVLPVLQPCALARLALARLGSTPPRLSIGGTPCSGSCGGCACRWQSHHSPYTGPSAGCARRWLTPCSRCSDSCGGRAGTRPSLRIHVYTTCALDRACTFRVLSFWHPSRRNVFFRSDEQ